MVEEVKGNSFALAAAAAAGSNQDEDAGVVGPTETASNQCK